VWLGLSTGSAHSVGGRTIVWRVPVHVPAGFPTRETGGQVSTQTMTGIEAMRLRAVVDAVIGFIRKRLYR
jgi:hypothetical protein